MSNKNDGHHADIDTNESLINEHNRDTDTIKSVDLNATESEDCEIEDALSEKTNYKNNHQDSDALSKIDGFTSHLNVDSNHNLLLEILARVRTIESSLIKNRTLISINNKVDKGKCFEAYHAFLKSNRLPLQNVGDMIMFERNLSDPKFKTVAVRIESRSFK